MSIRSAPSTITQAVVSAATAADIAAFERVRRAEAEEGVRLVGSSILRWVGTQPRDIAGLRYLVTEFVRAALPGQADPFVARYVRCLNGDRSFTLTVSYVERMELVLRPICDLIIASLRVT